MLRRMVCIFRGHKEVSLFPDREFVFQLTFKGKGPILIKNVYLCERCAVLFIKEKT
jgi:hypothetical protein